MNCLVCEGGWGVLASSSVELSLSLRFKFLGKFTMTNEEGVRGGGFVR